VRHPHLCRPVSLANSEGVIPPRNVECSGFLHICPPPPSLPVSRLEKSQNGRQQQVALPRPCAALPNMIGMTPSGGFGAMTICASLQSVSSSPTGQIKGQLCNPPPPPKELDLV